MQISREGTVLRLTVAGLALGLVVAGCSKGDEKSSSETSSAASSSAAASTSAEASGESSAAPAPAAGATDYLALLLKPEALPPTPDGPFTGDGPQQSVDGGVTEVKQNYKSGANNVSASIVFAPDETAAGTVLESTKAQLGTQVTGTPAPLPAVSDNATVVHGNSADGSASMSMLVFSEQKAIVTLVFIGKLNDSIPPEFVEQVGVLQYDAVKAGLPAAAE